MRSSFLMIQKRLEKRIQSILNFRLTHSKILTIHFSDVRYMEKKKDKVFIDTNILLYANVLNSALNKDAQQMLLRLIKEDSEVWISRQVIREYAAILTREVCLSMQSKMI